MAVLTWTSRVAPGDSTGGQCWPELGEQNCDLSLPNYQKASEHPQTREQTSSPIAYTALESDELSGGRQASFWTPALPLGMV